MEDPKYPFACLDEVPQGDVPIWRVLGRLIIRSLLLLLAGWGLAVAFLSQL